jgi:hypothetical protein
MKIIIEIPDFVLPERIIHIMAGFEKIGWIEPHTRKVHMKVSQCSQCGECCRKLECEHITEDNKCGLGSLWEPFRCCTTDGKMETCTSRYEE